MKRIIIALIRAYQRYISPLSGPCCRFSPTCSQYGLEAVQRFGAIKGMGLTVYRILRCNPWNPGGYDPVPEPDNNAASKRMIRTKEKNIKTIGYKAVKERKK